MDKPLIEFDAAVLECADVEELSAFYIRLLGWRRDYGEPGEWQEIVSDKGQKIAFQQNADYIPPVWPDTPGCQRQTAHLDFNVAGKAGLDAAVRHAINCGAVLAEAQYGGEEWTTLLDPAGHPFCLIVR